MSNGSTETSPAIETYQTLYDWSGERTLSSAVVFAIAEATGRDPELLPPLYESLDPDALDELFCVDTTDPVQSDGYVAFPFDGCRVTVHSSGRIIVESDPE